MHTILVYLIYNKIKSQFNKLKSKQISGYKFCKNVYTIIPNIILTCNK